MAKLLLLTKVMIKTTLGGSSQEITSSRSKLMRWGLYALLLVAFLPLMGSLYFLFNHTLELLVAIDQISILTNVVLAGVTIFVFLLSLLQIPSIYYYAKDTESFLALPVKPYQILGAKFITTLLYQYLLVIFFMVPFGLAMAQTQPPLMFYFSLVIISILLPVFPLLVSSLIIMLLMNFVPLFKNKNAMNIIIGFITIVFAVVFSLSSNSMGTISNEALISMLQQGNDSIASLMFTFIPTINLSARALNHLELVALGGVIIINVALFALYCVFAQGFYLNGAQGISESARSKTTFNSATVGKHTSSQPVIIALIKRELIELIRTPAYLLNCISITILMPALLFGPYLFSSASSDIDLVAYQGLLINNNSDLVMIAVIAGFLVGIFSSGLNSVSSTAISRDAYQLDALRALPVSKNTIILSKVFTGSLVSLITVFTLFIGALFILSLPWTFYVIFIFVSVLSVLSVNMLLIIIDVIKPKMNWLSEAQAVKQNFNSFLSIILSLVIPVIYGFVVFYYQLNLLLVIGLTLLSIMLMMGIFALFLKLYQSHIFNYH